MRILPHFRTQRTLLGTVVPAGLDFRVLLAVALLPANVVWTLFSAHPLFLLWHIGTIGVLVQSSLTERDRFLDGMDAGREEFVEQLLIAWENDVPPHEFVTWELAMDAPGVVLETRSAGIVHPD